MNQEQYEFIQEKYGKLIYMIAKKISGDAAKCDFEDNVQDLWITAIEAIKGYEIQNNGSNGKFEDFKDSKGFDQYIKTCLWHKKGKKGTDVTKKLGITDTFTIGETDVNDERLLFDIPDPKVVNINIHDEALEDIRVKLLPEERLIVQHILQHPDCLKDNGMINVHQIAKATKMKTHKVRYFVDYIKSRYNLTMM